MYVRELVLLCVVALVAADDFYQLLGIDKQASAKEIRKAFKKMALEKHPDKNKVAWLLII